MVMSGPTRIGPKKPFRVYLKEWREHCGLTQQQLADRLETHKGTISRWEGKSRQLELQTVVAICEALGIPPGAIFHTPPVKGQATVEDKIAAAPDDIREETSRFLDFKLSQRAR